MSFWMEHSEMKNPKQIAWDSSYSFGMTNGLPPSPLMAGNVGEVKCPPLSGCRERGRRRKAGEDCLSGASSAAPGSERSGRQKKTDNRRATFLGNFFAAGKKLRNAFILRRYNPEESRNRNRNNKICRYFEWRKNKEKVRFFTSDRNDNYSDWDR